VQTRQRPQFSGGSLQIPVSYPRLDTRLNCDLFGAAGLAFPSDAENRASGDANDDIDNDGDSEDDEDDGASGGESDSEVSEPGSADEADAAGAGVISGAGSSLNHVVSIAWSPIGLGPSRRPILAVLTSAGVIGMYGDGRSAEQNGGALGAFRGEDGLLKRRSLSSWAVLWGVGGHLVVPGQQSETSDFIYAFAWSKEIGPGKVLLAYITDVRDVVVISVQALSLPREPGGEPTGVAGGDAKRKTAWRVQEVARFKAEGPHPEMSPWDTDFVPQGTSFGLRWGPWLTSEGSRISVLSYVDRNYLGFRKIVLNEPPTSGDATDVRIDDADVYGKCISLSSDSIVEFEEAIWSKGKSKFVRGILATGFHVKPFEVTLVGPSPAFQMNPHPPEQCGTTYSDSQFHTPSTNPIQDLIIHPPNLVKSTATPTYTLIRLSATPSNHDWYQTNASLPDHPLSHGGASCRPRWVTDITQKLEISVPIDLHKHGTFGAGDDSDDASSDGDGDSDADSDEGSDGAIPQGPEVHPHRFRLHGLAASPGGGSSAVLVSGFATRQLDRGLWSDLKSTLMFDSKPRPRQDEGEHSKDDGVVVLRPLTTEGRMWEWMYSAGPPVPGITTRAGPDEDEGEHDPIVGKRKRMRELLGETIAQQRCTFCQEPLEIKGQGEPLSVCGKGHFFTTCGTSGLAIQAPGTSRTCGVCGARTLKVEALVSNAPELEGSIREQFTGDACGNCGGKFVD